MRHIFLKEANKILRILLKQQQRKNEKKIGTHTQKKYKIQAKNLSFVPPTEMIAIYIRVNFLCIYWIMD